MSAPKIIPKDKRPEYMNDVEDFFKKYYNSPAFERNVKQGASTWWNPDVASIRKKVLDQISSLKIQEDRSRGSEYWPGGNTLTMGDRGQALNTPDEQVFAHELSHSGDNIILPEVPRNIFPMLNNNKLYPRILEEAKAKGQKNEIAEAQSGYRKDRINRLMENMVSSWKQKDYDQAKDYAEDFNRDESSGAQHDNAPGEIRGDINALRYMLAKSGVWDITNPKSGQFTAEMLNKLYQMPELNKSMTRNGVTTLPTKVKSTRQDVKEPKNPGLFLNRLRERFSEDDIIWMINNLAKNQIDKKNNEYSV